jgi:HD-GYP domain-containing protein (c-di-GMP phosphodiesterase class II)
VQLELAELIGALSQALDITEGQPPGHCLRCAMLGMALADELGVAAAPRRELYYTLLLKDLGCSSNAARICELYLTDDLSFKRDFKRVGDSLPQVVRFVLDHTGLQAPLAERFRATLEIFQHGGEIATELIRTRCQRGAEIARRLRFDDAVALGVHGLDEHWDGSGRPDGLAGDAIPLAARVALLAQVADVFHTAGGPDAALAELRLRRGRWFDPALVDAFLRAAARDGFWHALRADGLAERVRGLEPERGSVVLDDDYLDEIAAAFGSIIDAKSPYTAGHSSRVALYADLLAERLGVDAARRRWLRRGALLHDLGKLGVSNAVLDKPAALSADEWKAVRMHPVYTERILGALAPFAELALVAGAHHERLDGGGYPRGLRDGAIALETRIITTADVFDAISAERPYRGAVPLPQTLQMMRRMVGSALDARCVDALDAVVEGLQPAPAGTLN